VSIDEITFRRLLAEVPTPVAVVTTIGASGEPYGMTVGSFCSLSLDPPLVLFCVARTARSHQPLRAADRYCLSILGWHQEQVARRFASRQEEDRFGSGIVTVDGLPAIRGSLVQLICSRHGLAEGGDHTIITAEVRSARTGTGSPLIYQRRRYRTVGRAAWTAARAITLKERTANVSAE
jgi:flavin reductase ActVB